MFSFRIDHLQCKVCGFWSTAFAVLLQRTQDSMIGELVFPIPVARAWNSLVQSSSLGSFKIRMNTELFHTFRCLCVINIVFRDLDVNLNYTSSLLPLAVTITNAIISLQNPNFKLDMMMISFIQRTYSITQIKV